MRRPLRPVRAAGALLLALPVAYLLAALLLGVLPLNARNAPPTNGPAVTIFLRTNGVHADLVLPARAPFDWTVPFPPAALIDVGAVRSAGHDWIAFGWGDRAFYLETPTWAQLRAATALTALSGRAPSAMHVEYIVTPQDFDVAALRLSPGQYMVLVDFIAASFARDDRGAVRRIDHPGHGPSDAFYEAVGSYSPLLTSNDWVRRGLAQAGVRTARWAPFDRALFWHARRMAPAN